MTNNSDTWLFNPYFLIFALGFLFPPIWLLFFLLGDLSCRPKFTAEDIETCEVSTFCPPLPTV